MARYVSGEIGDADFLAQPVRFNAAARLLLYKGLRREREGKIAEALEAYRAYNALPRWRRYFDPDPLEDLFAQWRFALLSAHPR